MPRMRGPHLEPLLEIHEYQGPLGVQGMDDSPQGVHSMPAVDWQPAMFECGGHHGGIAGPRKASSAAAGGCTQGEPLTRLTEDACTQHSCPKTRSSQPLAGCASSGPSLSYKQTEDHFRDSRGLKPQCRAMRTWVEHVSSGKLQVVPAPGGGPSLRAAPRGRSRCRRYLWSDACEQALWTRAPPLTLLEHLPPSLFITYGPDRNALFSGVDSAVLESASITVKTSKPETAILQRSVPAMRVQRRAAGAALRLQGGRQGGSGWGRALSLRVAETSSVCLGPGALRPTCSTMRTMSSLNCTASSWSTCTCTARLLTGTLPL